MLFHSQLFLVVFLPLALIGYYVLASRRLARIWWLILASFVFYGYWDFRLIPLLAGSIVVNWILARVHALFPLQHIVTIGVVVNLALLGVFKYADFAADSVAWLGGWEHRQWSIILPLAISFFTFQQISYLADLSRGTAPTYRFHEFALYICFFPQLIAGPIVRHNEIIFQLSEAPKRDGLDERLARGLTLFVVGLGKKVLLADQLVKLADPVFAKAAAGEAVLMADGWIATWAYTFQLYFDFSGYSDMAIGLALMFGFNLPLNFNAPYQATSIRDFWRRWHMTLTRFMRDYVYVPIGLRFPFARRGKYRLPDLVSTLITMGLLGLWHGAAWTYVIFGLIHGVAVVANQLWRRLRLSMPAIVGWALTILFFALSLVLFRSESVGVTIEILTVMLTGGGDGDPTVSLGLHKMILLACAAAIAMLGPTSQKVVLDRLKPQPVFAAATAVTLVAVMVYGGGPDTKEFIYFQF